MSIAVSAVGLSKRYAMPRAPGGWLDALADVSFDIQQGEAVGLIGRNGAGKSTLLRILSRVTRPTGGHADVYGTVGALLEVGTGFHPELTGRENTFLSGAILGLSKADVQARFDAIVAFAGIEPFIDTPVKRYSSGMYARLGFAVAAHLRPSMLIVDEVLAVGDLAFQAKCLAHMHRLTDDGTTVLFVSHNLLAIADLCPRAIYLENGRAEFDGDAKAAIARYRSRNADRRDSETRDSGQLGLVVNGRPPTDAVEVLPNGALSVETTISRAPGAPSVGLILNLVIETTDGRVAIHLRSDESSADLVLAPGENTFRTRVADLGLAPGRYAMWMRAVSLDAVDPDIRDSKRIWLDVRGSTGLDTVGWPRHVFERGA